MLETWKLNAFDGLELIRSANIQMDAPKHFHEGYAIGIATKGLQTIILQNGDYIIGPYSFMFLDPGEIHAHKAFEHIAWSHKMLYISPEYISWLQKNNIIHVKGTLSFKVPLATDNSLYQTFYALHTLLASQLNNRYMEREFDQCMGAIFNHYATEKLARPNGDLCERMMDIQYYIEGHFHENLNLEKLSKTFHLSKFKLIRNFKQNKGITPNEYLTILRVEKAKKFILEGNSLVASAVEAGFYDQSHFSHNFLKYTSFTPGQFKKGCTPSFNL
jgi:AraC-like DNA-binding protein